MKVQRWVNCADLLNRTVKIKCVSWFCRLKNQFYIPIGQTTWRILLQMSQSVQRWPEMQQMLHYISQKMLSDEEAKSKDERRLGLCRMPNDCTESWRWAVSVAIAIIFRFSSLPIRVLNPSFRLFIGIEVSAWISYCNAQWNASRKRYTWHFASHFTHWLPTFSQKTMIFSPHLLYFHSTTTSVCRTIMPTMICWWIPSHWRWSSTMWKLPHMPTPMRFWSISNGCGTISTCWPPNLMMVKWHLA